MSDADHGMTAIEIKIFVAVSVPNVAAATANYFHIIKWEYIKWFHLIINFQKAAALSLSPSVSGRPNIIFIFSTACPAAPFKRLSITEVTSRRSPYFCA